MESRSLKTLIQRLLTDPTLRAQFIHDPATALAGFRVSPEENQALHRLHGRLATAGGVGLPQTTTWWP